jgi:predicted PurR-regulated permease PerM
LRSLNLGTKSPREVEAALYLTDRIALGAIGIALIYIHIRNTNQLQGAALAITGCLTAFLLWALGVPYFLLFGLIAGLVIRIPIAGPALALCGPFLVALSESHWKAIGVLGFCGLELILMDRQLMLWSAASRQSA